LVRDAGGADAGVKQAVEQGLVLGPRMQISISVLTITGGHGDGWMPSGNEFNIFPAYPGNPDGRCDGVEEARRKVRELGLMCSIGMTPMQVIVATTRVAAECLGWQDRVGTIEVGKLADVIIMKTDPLKDIRSLEKSENIAVVMKDGKIVKDRR
jgi:imidazolonepropionase-like amidohydrolase